ncbi:MAG: hypothetical protein J7L95_07660 [Prolixibacteraceae bacterium]|nr:hypothetical protein [Prolixibacteraceae bacterium]
MEELFLFSDGSVDNQSEIGFGACLIVENLNLSVDELKMQVRVKKFENTSSTKLELQTLIWGLTGIYHKNKKITVYSDSQNIIGLHGRRERLEKNNYRTKKNELITNHELYKKFFKLTDRLTCTFVKVQGHKKSNQKSNIEKIFTIVDRASRSKLRNINQ